MVMKKWAIPLGISMGGTLLWWTHRILTDVFPPFDNAFDTVLWVVCSVLKLATIVCIPFALGPIFARCHRNLRKSAIAVSAWGLALVLLLAVLTLVRVPLTAELNDESMRFFPNSLNTHPPIALAYLDVDAERQVARWQSGVTFLTELGLIVAGVLSMGLLGFYLGKWMIAEFAATIWLAALFVIGSFALNLVVWDYDIFLAGTMIAPISLDVLVPYRAGVPTSEIGFLVYTVLIWTSWLLDVRLLGVRAAVAEEPVSSAV
jgi:hypothetical protein